jgi:hypothetical protein
MRALIYRDAYVQGRHIAAARHSNDATANKQIYRREKATGPARRFLHW